ncbi:MAG TPA: RNA polymerase sigma-70 factor [Acidimicrobiales bacterium]
MSADEFARHRGLLFTVAYEMLGSASDAEDVVQETWLRWSGVDQASVCHPRAYLVRIVTRQALNRLRTVSRRREDYVGEWLPEPLVTSPDVADDVELAESVSVAMLTVLETLGPVERAVFVLREVFDTPYDEIAETVGKTPAAVRQVAHRAREHVAARRPRMEVTRAEHTDAVERFLAALQSGDVPGLLAVLAPDVVLVADGGGVAAAVRRPVAGADAVARVLSGFASLAGRVQVETVLVNGGPGVRVDLDGTLDTVVSLAVEDGRIARIFAMRNPEKLAWSRTETPLTR